jgi:hypothetical protein
MIRKRNCIISTICIVLSHCSQIMAPQNLFSTCGTNQMNRLDTPALPRSYTNTPQTHLNYGLYVRKERYGSYQHVQHRDVSPPRAHAEQPRPFDPSHPYDHRGISPLNTVQSQTQRPQDYFSFCKPSRRPAEPFVPPPLRNEPSPWEYKAMLRPESPCVQGNSAASSLSRSNAIKKKPLERRATDFLDKRPEGRSSEAKRGMVRRADTDLNGRRGKGGFGEVSYEDTKEKNRRFGPFQSCRDIY